MDYILKNCKLYLQQWNLSGDLNEIHVVDEVEAVEDTAFGDANRSYLQGFHNTVLRQHGNWNGGTDELDDALWQSFAVDDQVVTVAPISGAAGERAYLLKGTAIDYRPGGRIGEVFAFDSEFRSRGLGLIRGTFMENGAKTSSGSGTARQLGAVAADQKLYAMLHVIKPVTGTSIAVIVESDDAVGFGSPTTRATFTTATVPTSQLITVPGPITDDWWRISWTVVGGGPSFPIVVVLAIK
jgi:hypothetical protein